MFGLSFLKPKKADAIGSANLFKNIELDIHAHLIPGIDDGASDLMVSVELLKAMRDMGFKRVTATPHISELYPNTNDAILDGLILLKKEIKKYNIDIEVSVAAEYMINDLFEQMIQSDTPLLTLPMNHILVEMPHIDEPANLNRVLELLRGGNYTPIMAHPERYRYYNGDLDAYWRLKEKGCLLQVNVLSLTGYYGRQISRCAWAMLDEKMIDFIGTDLHHNRHLDNIETGMTVEIEDMLKHYPFKNHQLLQTTTNSSNQKKHTIQ
jgi:protein-tyrosine phosphatase